MMEEGGFPDKHTTTTTVTSSNTSVQTNIRYDPAYLKSLQGLVKCVQLVLNLLIFLMVILSKYSHVTRLRFMSFICGFGFWFTGTLLAFYLFHVIEKFYNVPWLKVELIYCGLWTVMLLFGSIFCAAFMGMDVMFGVIAFLGCLVMLAYGYDSYIKLKGIRNGEIAQGERVIVQTTSSSPSQPNYYS